MALGLAESRVCQDVDRFRSTYLVPPTLSGRKVYSDDRFQIFRQLYDGIAAANCGDFDTKPEGVLWDLPQWAVLETGVTVGEYAMVARWCLNL